jgi:mycothiol synthase
MQEPRKENLPQLRMQYPAALAPTVPAPAPGYQLRAFAAGDEAGWAALLNANGELGSWSIERIEGVLAGGLKRQFFIASAEGLVACAGVHDVALEGTPYWEIGWVASHPAHRGRGLGGQVTAAAVGYALGLPRRPILLRTDDFRLPAIKVYLQLGFAPLLDHPSYPERWRLIGNKLGPRYQVPLGAP